MVALAFHDPKKLKDAFKGSTPEPEPASLNAPAHEFEDWDWGK